MKAWRPCQKAEALEQARGRSVYGAHMWPAQAVGEVKKKEEVEVVVGV